MDHQLSQQHLLDINDFTNLKKIGDETYGAIYQVENTNNTNNSDSANRGDAFYKYAIMANNIYAIR